MQQSTWEIKESPEGIKELCDSFDKRLNSFLMFY